MDGSKPACSTFGIRSFNFSDELGALLFAMSLVAAPAKPRSVLIATDFSEASEKPLRHALAIARFYGSRFCLAHVVSSLGLTMAGPGAIATCEEAVSRDAACLRDFLIRTGALNGVQHKFTVRQGEVWPELREIIRQQEIDLLVVGTHGRHGLGKLFFGSVAEQIFRQADCPVLNFGPRSHEHPWVGSSYSDRTFLFATDFGQASLHGLPQAIAAANQFGAKLVFLSIIPAVPLPRCRGSHTAQDLSKFQEDARMKTLHRLAELTKDAVLDVRPEFHAEFASMKTTSERILEIAERLKADLIIMGLHYSAHTGLVSHLDWATAYDVVCHASSPVLTVNSPSGDIDIRSRAPQVAKASLSKADLIRIHALGVKW